jgi:hypothetical protein
MTSSATHPNCYIVPTGKFKFSPTMSIRPTKTTNSLPSDADYEMRSSLCHRWIRRTGDDRKSVLYTAEVQGLHARLRYWQGRVKLNQPFVKPITAVALRFVSSLSVQFDGHYGRGCPYLHAKVPTCLGKPFAHADRISNSRRTIVRILRDKFEGGGGEEEEEEEEDMP